MNTSPDGNPIRIIMNQTLITFDSMLTTAGGWKHDETLKYGRGISKRLIFTAFCVTDCAVLSSYLINLPFSYNTFFPSHSIFTILPNYFYLFHFTQPASNSLFSLRVVF